MLEKGCPGGKAGSCCEGSTRVFSSSTVGARQPFCPPTSFSAQRATERLQTSCSRSGSCSQINPVWLSFTAAPPITNVNRDDPEESAARITTEWVRNHRRLIVKAVTVVVHMAVLSGNRTGIVKKF